LLLTASVLCGILVPARLSNRQRPAWFLDLHRGLAGLTVGFVALHLAALVADSYVQFGLADVVIPFASEWKPVPVALGVVAMWLLVVVQATSVAKKHLPRRIWRRIHLASYLCFFLTTLHGTLAGTDATNIMYNSTSVAAVAAVVWATVYRIMTRRGRTKVHARPTSTPTSGASVRASLPSSTGDRTAGTGLRSRLTV
jgi:DMSO/TMAO reductase YedYZ heme-binding membrane subunit